MLLDVLIIIGLVVIYVKIDDLQGELGNFKRGKKPKNKKSIKDRWSA